MTIEEKIQTYGAEILRSELFQKAYKQKHHLYSTVGDHSLDVARTALFFAEKWEKKGKKIDEKMLVSTSLCHDFGILGRYEGKFRSSLDCCKRHPKESAKEYQKLFPQAEKKELKIIERHMFPATLLPPDSIEGWLIVLADKLCGVAEVANSRKYRTWEARNAIAISVITPW